MADSGSLKKESGRTFDHKYQKRKSQGLRMFFPIYFYPKLYILIRNPVQWIERLPIRILAIFCQNISNLEYGARVTFLVSILHVSYFKNPLSSRPIGTAGHPSWVGELRMVHTGRMGAQAGLRTEHKDPWLRMDWEWQLRSVPVILITLGCMPGEIPHLPAKRVSSI